MSFGGPTKYCPRCNTLLPVQATVCSTCGLQFSAPSGQGSGYGAAPYGGQSGPSGWPQSQPAGYPPPAQPGYGGYTPQGQFGPAGYAPAGYAPPPAKKSKTGLIVVILVVVVLLAGGGTAAFLYLRGHSTSPSSPLFDRHSLPSNIPLPDNVTFVSMKTITTSSESISIVYDVWYWTVSNNAPASVQQFYKMQLPSNGWTHVQADSGGDSLSVDACQGNQALSVGLSQHLQDVNPQGTPAGTVDAPPGGTTLGIALTSSPALVQILCSGNQATP